MALAAAVSAVWLAPRQMSGQGVNAGGVIIGPRGANKSDITNTVNALTQSATNVTVVHSLTVTNDDGTPLFYFGPNGETNATLKNATSLATDANGKVIAGAGGGSSSYIVGGNTSQNFGSGHTYLPWAGSSFSASSISDAKQPFAKAATLSRFYVVATPALGVGQNVSFTVMTNGVDSNVTCSITGDATTVAANDTTHTCTVAAGDTITIDWSTTLGSPGSTRLMWSFQAQ